MHSAEFSSLQPALCSLAHTCAAVCVFVYVCVCVSCSYSVLLAPRPSPTPHVHETFSSCPADAVVGRVSFQTHGKRDTFSVSILVMNRTRRRNGRRVSNGWSKRICREIARAGWRRSSPGYHPVIPLPSRGHPPHGAVGRLVG